MIRILQIFDRLNVGGTETFVLNLFRNIDRSKIMFDFFVSGRTGSSIEKEVENLGARIYTYTSRKEGLIRYYRSIHDFYRKNAKFYKGAHLHSNSFTSMLPLSIAADYDIPLRISHCHNTSTHGLHNKILHSFNRSRINKIANRYLACSSGALEYGYKGTSAYQKALVIPNGIEMRKYKFSQDNRDQIRRDLGLTDEFTIGSIAAFRPVKNHQFMLQIMQEIIKISPHSKLILAGDGQTFKDIQQTIIDMKMEDYVVLLGMRKDTHKLLQAFDVFLMPSFYEGLPFSLIEAQASGLPAVVSSSVSKESELTNLLTFASLEQSAGEWAKLLLKTKADSRLQQLEGKLGKFDIMSTVNILTDIYNSF